MSIDWEETDRKPCGRMNKEESVDKPHSHSMAFSGTQFFHLMYEDSLRIELVLLHRSSHGGE